MGETEREQDTRGESEEVIESQSSESSMAVR